jgi:hypothetical protein
MEAYDHLAPATVADPFPEWAELREEPVNRSPLYGGYAMLARYDDVLAAAQDP